MTDSAVYFREAESAYRARDWERALQDYRRTLAVDSQHIDACCRLADVFGILGRWRDQIEAGHQLLDILQEQGDWPACLAVARRLVEVGPAFARARWRLIHFLERAGEALGFPGCLESDLELAESLVSVGRVQDGRRLFRKVATAYRERGQFLKAVDAYRRLRGLTPDDVGLLMTLGNLYVRQGMDPQAELEYRAVLRLQPEHQEALLCLARLCERGGRTRHAVLAYQRFLTFHPDDVGALEELGTLHHEQGAGEQAALYYLAAARAYLEIEDHGSAWRLFGMALELRGAAGPAAIERAPSLESAAS